MAEKEGFEPSMGVKAHTPLAGERLRPLGHLSVFLAHILLFDENKSNPFSETDSIWTVFNHIAVISSQCIDLRQSFKLKNKKAS